MRGAASSISVLLAALSAFVQPPLNAAELRLDGSVTGRAEYSDNLSLRFDPDPGWRFTLTPAVTLSRNTESSSISGRAYVGFNYYTNDELEDTEPNDRGLNLNAVQRLERSELGLRLDYYRQTSPQEQLATTGINLGTQYTERWSVVPWYSRSLTDRLSLQLSAEYRESRYTQFDDDTTEEETKSVTAGFTYAFTPRASGGLSVSYFEFDAEPRVSKSDSLSLNANGSYLFSETLSVSGSLGIQRTKQTSTEDVLVCPVDPVFCQLDFVSPILVAQEGESKATNYPFNLSLQWAMSEVENVYVSASNTVGQYGTGATSVRTTASAGYSRSLSERLNLTLWGSITQQRNLDRDSLSASYNLSPAVAYRISERWSATAGYIYDRVGYEDTDEDIDANTVYATLSYNWPLYLGSW